MLYDIIKSRRSIRRFQEKEVESEKMELLLNSALLAPSSRAVRPWEFIAVTDRTILQKLSLCREYGSQFLAGAPLGIVIVADTQASDVWVEDTSIAAAFVHLTARSLDLGSCWIQVRERLHSEKETAGDYIKALLGIPEKYAVECIAAVGYPAEEKKPYGDPETLQEKLHFDRF